MTGHGGRVHPIRRMGDGYLPNRWRRRAAPLRRRRPTRGGPWWRRCGRSCAPSPAAPASWCSPSSPRWSGRTSTPGSYESFWRTDAVDPARRARRDPGPADLGEQRPDDVLLPRRRAGGAARDRPRRPARPAPAACCRSWPALLGMVAARRSSTSRSTRPTAPPAAGAWRCRPTPRSRSACSPCSAGEVPDRTRVFLLTMFVVDDLAALVVIAVVYSDDSVELLPILRRRARAGRHGRHARARGATGAGVPAGRRRDVVGAADQRGGPGGGRAGDRADRAGVHARPRQSLEEATGLFRRFREQPTAGPGPDRGDPAERDAVAERAAAARSTTRGPATSSSRCSGWPTRASC